MFYLDESLLLGIKEIDDEHKELCLRANKLFDALIAGHVVSEITICMAYFEKYINTHFNNEEKLQQEFNYPMYLNHKKKHDEFKNIYNNLKTEMQIKGITSDFVQKFSATVIDWLTMHLHEEDAGLVKYIKEYRKISK